ncbi:sensor domain-containing phosphodiesterase [Crocosphaera subtropica]|nr:EAL domain-containing protein [Crocosphaera subtropica]
MNNSPENIREAFSEQRVNYYHQLALDNLMDVISFHTVEGIYLYISPSCQSFLGYEPQVFIGQSAEVLCHPEDCDVIRTFYQQLKQQWNSDPITYRIRHAVGHYVWLETSAKVIPNQKTGEIQEILCISREVTKQKQNQEHFKNYQQPHIFILDNLPDLITTHSKEGIFQYVSQVSYQLLGYIPQALIGRTLASFCHGQDQVLIKQFYQELEQKKSLASVIYRMSHQEGYYLWIETLGKVILHPQTGEIQEILCVSRNITKRKQIEEALIQAERQYYKIFEKSNQGIFQLSPEGYFIDVNPALAQLYGYNNPQDLLESIHKRTNPVYVEGKNHDSLLDILKTDGEIINFQSQIYCKNGEIIDIEETIWAVYDQCEQILYYQGTVQKVINPQIKGDTLTRIQLETDLRQAIKNKQLSLYYQPIVELDTGHLSGFEALIRWQHPIKGPISPIEFIPIAEESGLINTLGWWVLEQACYQLQTWQNLNTQAAKLVMNVNVSAQQLKQETWVERLNHLLEKMGVEGKQLKLEITESCLLETVQNETQRVRQLKNLGLGLCIDDFGTGYSSLSRLHEFPIDTLKIDRSFISKLGISDKVIVPMIINLAHTLGMNVVAEGIETREQFNQLQGLNCELGQGFFFAKPMTGEQATHWVMQEIRSRQEFGVNTP